MPLDYEGLKSERLLHVPPRTGESGLTLLEVLFGLTLFTLSIAVVGMGLHAAHLSTRQMQEELLVQGQAQDLVDILRTVPFGTPTDASVSGAQLSEVFDGDEDPGTVTLYQLSRWPEGDGGWIFSVPGFPLDGEWRIQVDHDIHGDGIIGDPSVGAYADYSWVYFVTEPSNETTPSEDGDHSNRSERAQEVSNAGGRKRYPNVKTIEDAEDVVSFGKMEIEQNMFRLSVFYDGRLVLNTNRALESGL